MTLALHYALRSDVGLLREGNEDSAYAGPRLLAIADGMGGHAAGEVASAVAISAIAPLDKQNLTDSEDMLDALAAAVAAARNTLHDMSVSDPAVEGHGDHADRAAVGRRPGRGLPHRRLPRLPAAGTATSTRSPATTRSSSRSSTRAG